MRRSLLALGLVLTTALAGCAGNRYKGALPEANLNAPYTLASGDRLRIIVFGQDSLTNSYAVDSSGHISMPLIGLVRAYGHTTHDLERAVESRLRAGFLREPRVSVEVEAFRPFFVLGEVNTSGQYPYISGMTVQTAIAVAGGYSPRASQSTVDITRIIDGHPVTGTVSVTQAIQPGDTIVVRERFF